MLDIWGDMLVVRVGGGQSGVVGMSLGIVPIQPFVAFPYYIAVLQNLQIPRVKVYQFGYIEAEAIGENQNPNQPVAQRPVRYVGCARSRKG